MPNKYCDEISVGFSPNMSSNLAALSHAAS